MKSATLSLKGSYRFALVLAIIAALLTAAGTLVIPAGSLDSTFGKNGVTITNLGSDSDSGNAVALQPDGKIVLAGSAVQDNPYHRTPFLLRYSSNGSVDTSFGTNGRFTTEVGTFSGSGAVIGPDGKLLVSGSLGRDMAVARYNPSGVIDTSFGINGIASLHHYGNENDYCVDLAVQPNGAILLAGTQEIGNYAYFELIRLNSDGTLDSDFDHNSSEVMWDFPNKRFNYAAAVVIQADGKIVIAGSMTDNDGVGPRISLARLNADGSADSTFGVGGRVETEFGDFQTNNHAIALQADGKLLVAGTSFPVRNTAHVTDDLAVARFNTNGSLDTTFGGTGIVLTDFGNNEYGNSVAALPDGRIVVAGRASGPDDSGLLLVQYMNDGSLDTSFGTNGRVVTGAGSDIQTGNAVVIQPGSKILVAGSGNGNVALARYTSTTRNLPILTTTFRSLPEQDGWLLESTENSNLGGTRDKLATTFNVGDNAKDRQYRGLISFNTSPIPDTAVITAAQLNVKRQGLVGTNPYTTHGPLLLDMRSGAFSNNVTLQLTDFSAPATPGAIQDQLSALPLINWYGSTLSAGNLPFINRLGITQFRLQFSKDDNDDMSADYLKFFSGNSDLANQPQLIITYYVP